MKLLTNSMRRKFGSCPKSYQHAYVMLRRPRIDAEALTFGTLWHKVMEAWWGSNTEHRLLSAQHALSVELGRGSDPYHVGTCRALLSVYDRLYRNQQLETIDVEVEFRAPLMNPETGGVSKTWMLAGKIDAIARENSGRVIIVEHKTTSSDIDACSDYWRKLSIDGQVSGYYLGGRSLGYDIEDCLYDVVRKPGIRPKKETPLSERKYTKDGKLYAVQNERDETPEEWEARVLQNINDNPERYFAQKRVARLDSDMQDYLFDMWAVGRNLADAERLGRFSRNPDSCSGFGTCEYFSVCSGMASIDDDSLFVTIENANPELSPPSKDQLWISIL